MPMLPGRPSDDLPDVLAAGSTDVKLAFVSMSARDPDGRDAEYIEWHSLDHRPEQYRLAGIRHAERLVSTPACRAARAASGPRYEPVDHVMTYFFADAGALPSFAALGAALGRGGRMPVRLPSVELGVFALDGRLAAPRVGVGADVVAWRPSLGAYLLVEEGSASPAELVDVDGVAGIWWHRGERAPAPFETDHRGVLLTYCFLDEDPVEVAERLRGPLDRRWRAGDVSPVLAAPFHTVVPFEWDRFLPDRETPPAAAPVVGGP